MSRNKNVSQRYYLIPVLFQNERKINAGLLVELNSKELCLVNNLAINTSDTRGDLALIQVNTKESSKLCRP